MATKTLPLDIISEIISRLPVKPLIRFKCVAKSWNSLINLPKFIKQYHKLDVKAFNHHNLTAGDIIYSNDHFHNGTQFNLSKALPRGRRTNNGDEKRKDAGREETNNVGRVKGVEERMNDLKKTGETRLVVAVLIVTVSFTAGFTVPGGFDQTPGDNIGMAVLTNEIQFLKFMITDTIAFMLSCLAVMCHFAIAGEKDVATANKLSRIAEHLNTYSLVALMAAFQSGVDAVVSVPLGDIIIDS